MNRKEIKAIVEAHTKELYGLGDGEIIVKEENLLDNVLKDSFPHDTYTSKPKAKMKSETKKKISKARRGFVMSEEQKERLRENSQRFNVYQYKDGVLINIWKSTREAQRAGYNNSLISKVCRGLRPYAYGCVWRYKPIEEGEIKVSITVTKTFRYL